jgi:hypothetical protein
MPEVIFRHLFLTYDYIFPIIAKKMPPVETRGVTIACYMKDVKFFFYFSVD